MRSPVALRLALRELRGGLAGFRIFLACLALGVAAIAAVGTVRMAIQQGLSREAASILGGDAQIEFTYRFADKAEQDWMAANSTEISGIVDFRSMAVLEDAAGETQRALVQVKAVDGAYPLYGDAVLAGGGTLADALAPRDGLPGLVAQRILIDRFGLEPGDVLRLGTTEFRLSDELLVEPDAAASGFGLGPRVIVLLDDLEDSGLLSEGSLFDSSYRLRLAPDADLEALRDDARTRFADTGLQWRDRRNGAPGLSAFVDRLGSFLVLIGLAGPRGGRRRGLGGGARASRRQDRDHRHAQDARSDRRHDLRGLSHPDRPPGTGGHRAGAGARRRRAAARGAADRGAVAGAGGLRPLSPPAGRSRRLWRADRAHLQHLAAGPRPRHPRGRALPRPDRRAPRLAGAAVHRDDGGPRGGAGRARDLAVGRAGADPRHRRRGDRGALGAASGGAGAAASRPPPRPGTSHPRPAGAALGARRPRRTFRRDRLGGALARPRPLGAGGGRADRFQPARPDHPRPAGAGARLFLRRHPERPARGLPRHGPRRTRRDGGGDSTHAARHHHPHQRPPGARGRGRALGAQRRPGRDLCRHPAAGHRDHRRRLVA